MPLSKPMKLMTLRLNEDEKRHLEEMARSHNITLSHALREGARLYLRDLEEHRSRPTRQVVS